MQFTFTVISVGRFKYSILFGFIRLERFHLIFTHVKERCDEIARNDNEVQYVKIESIGESLSRLDGSDDFTDQRADVAEHDDCGKKYTFAFCGTRFNAFIKRDRPRATETNKHSCFKNTCHFLLRSSILKASARSDVALIRLFYFNLY